MVFVPKDVTFAQSARQMAVSGPLNVLLVATPVAILSYALAWPAGVTFVFSMIALCPLAERLGYVTEQISLHTNETVGGLLNASFGNATELIVAITSLSKGLYRLVQLSLLGSILSNLLLVLGTAFLFGGLRHKTQSYGTISSQVNSTLLMVSNMAIFFPTILYWGGQATNAGQLIMSRATSVVLLSVYLAFLYFQLSTHKHLYEDENKPTNGNQQENPHGNQIADESSLKRYLEIATTAPITTTGGNSSSDSPTIQLREKQILRPITSGIEGIGGDGDNEQQLYKNDRASSSDILDQQIEHIVRTVPSKQSHASSSSCSGSRENLLAICNPRSSMKDILEGDVEMNGHHHKKQDEQKDKENNELKHDKEEDEEEEEEDELGYYNGIIWLTIMTAIIAVLSETISSSIQDAADSAGISGVFIAAIVLPIVGNAAEHAGAVLFAMKGKLNLTLGVAIGSSTQIALFVMPALVILGWMMGKDLDMNFGAYEAGTIVLTVISVTFAIKDGTSNWLIGITLIAAYIIIAIGFLVHFDNKLD